MLLRLEAVSRSFAGRVLFANASLAVHRGDRIGLVGANGVGKTTLLKIAAGDDEPDAGRVMRGRDVRIGRLHQEIDPSRPVTVFDEVSKAFAELDDLERELGELEREMETHGSDGAEVPPELADRYDRCRAAFEVAGGFGRAARVDRVLAGLGFDEEARHRQLATFSGGWLMRVELAKLLLAEPDVLLLDEPTNHLDLPSIQWFEETLEDYGGAVVIISHDRTFLRRHAHRVAELERGQLQVYDGGWDRYVESKRMRREELIARKRTQDREIAHTERFIQRFRAKNTKARQVQSKIKALERMDRVEIPDDRKAAMRLRIPPATRAGDEVLRLDEIHKSYDETVVYRGASLLLRRGERVALVGPNGAGKSTLLRIAAGALPFDSGDRRPGHNVTLAFYAQHQLEELTAGRTVLQEIESVATNDDRPRLRGHLGAFLFSGDDVDKKVEVLSGGEKARLALAKLLLRPANLLVLDEPTNHLDVTAREVLEAALKEYTGTVLFITHDRTLINALATRLVEVEAGSLASYPGGYDDYLHAKARGIAPVDPFPPASEPVAERPAEVAPKPRDEAAKRERIEAREREKERARQLARAKKRLSATEDEIAQLEEEVEALNEDLAHPGVYSNGEAVLEIETQKAGFRDKIAALYGEWEAIAGEVEALESGESEPAAPAPPATRVRRRKRS